MALETARDVDLKGARSVVDPHLQYKRLEIKETNVIRIARVRAETSKVPYKKLASQGRICTDKNHTPNLVEPMHEVAIKITHLNDKCQISETNVSKYEGAFEFSMFGVMKNKNYRSASICKDKGRTFIGFVPYDTSEVHLVGLDG